MPAIRPNPTLAAIDVPEIRSIETDANGRQTSCLYGFNVDLVQADSPWNPAAPLSAADLVVCADTVTLAVPVANPGRDVRIYARQVVCLPGGALITSATPQSDAFDSAAAMGAAGSPGVAGSPGSAGGPGASGGPAGNVVVMAGSLLGAQGAVAGNPATSPILPSSLVLPAFTLTPAAWTDPSGTTTVTGSFAFADTVVANQPGSDGLRVQAVEVSGSQLVYTLAPLALSGSASFSGTSQLKGVGNLPVDDQVTWSAPGVTATAAISLGQPGSAPIVQVSALQVGFVDIGMQGVLSGLLATIQGQVAQTIAASLQSALAGAISSTAPDLVVLAIGGAGGRGQDGGCGGQGGVGAPGKNSDEVVYTPLQPPLDTVGGEGATGGQGGDAGHSGGGGPGGVVSIGYAVGAPVNVATEVLAGIGGAAAQAGPGGPGGEGGAAGSYYYSDGAASERVSSWSGKAGLQGPPAQFQGAQGALGADGSVAAAATDVASLAPWFPTAQLLLSQQAASLAYLQAQQQAYQDILALLLWLRSITVPFLDTTYAPAGWQPADTELARQVNAFAATQISNINCGFDFYGHPVDWVPLLTLAAYQDDIAAWLAIGADIEQQVQAYAAAGQAQDQQRAAVQSAANSQAKSITALQNQITALGQQITDAAQGIAAMQDQLEKQQNAIAQDTETFTLAFQAYVAPKGCTFSSFVEVVSAISGIVQIGTGLLDGVGLVTGAATEANAAAQGVSAFKNMVVVIDKINASIESIEKGLTLVNGVVSGIKPPVSQPDVAGMVAVDQQQFDDFIGQYLGDFGAAQTLKDAVDGYFGMVNALNQAILSYNGLYITQAQLSAQLAQHQQQLAQLGPVLAAGVPDPSLAVCASFMQAAYASIRNLLLQQLYEEGRACYYWSLKAPDLVLDDTSIASLGNTHAMLLQQIQDAQSGASAPAQPFKQSVSVTAQALPVAFAQLQATGVIAFPITTDNAAFENMYQVIASGFEIHLPDVQATSGVLSLELTHPGTSVQVSPESPNPVVQFTHAQRKVPYKLDFGNPANTAGGALGDASQGYVGVSPFTAWTLDFSSPGNSWLDLKTIQSIVVIFSGTYAGAAVTTA